MRLGDRLAFPTQLPAWCMLACGLAAACALSFWADRREQSEERANFERRTEFRGAALQQEMTNAIDALQVVNRLFVINGNIGRDQFHSFTQPLRARYPYIEAFAFQRLVSREERPAFEARMGSRFPGFTIDDIVDGKRVVAGAKDRYRVVDYVEPMAQGHEAAFGLDASSLPSMDEVIRRADDTGRPAASDLSPLMMSGAQRGVRIVMAVYKSGTVPDDAAARRRAVVGYTTVVLRPGALVEKILASSGSLGHAGLDIRVYAAASADQAELVYQVPGATTWNRGAWRPAWLLKHRQEPYSHRFDVADREWRIDISAQPAPFLASHADALLALLLGLLVTFAGTAYLRSVALRAQRIHQLVAQRTEEIEQVNGSLVEYIKAGKLAEEALRQSRSKLRNLANHHERIKEDERKRIARDIHDDLGQDLIALRIDVSMMAEPPTSAAITRTRIDAAVGQIDLAIEAVRVIINNLRPATLDLGLHAAVEWQAMEFERRTGITCEVDIDHDEFALDDKRATALFRMVQESLANIIHHARASRVHIALQRTNDRLFMKIADDGVGLADDYHGKPNTFGLIGIQERIHALHGTFSTASAPGEGMTIMVSIPI